MDITKGDDMFAKNGFGPKDIKVLPRVKVLEYLKSKHPRNPHSIIFIYSRDEDSELELMMSIWEETNFMMIKNARNML